MSSRQARIASIAKVSQSTVSRALRNHPDLPKETCLRIQSLAQRLGYSANPLLSSIFANLRRRRGSPEIGTLAFLTAHARQNDWRNHPGSYRDFFLGARERAAKQGFAVEAHWAAESGMPSHRLNSILHARGISGVILSTRDAEQHFASLDWDQFALVRIGLSQQAFPVHCAVNDQYRTVRLVAGQLASRGYTRIGLALSRWQDEVTDHSWLAGYSVWQQTQPTRNRVPTLVAANFSDEAFFAWFKRHKPDAVISVNPDVVRWLRSSGISMPEKVGAAVLDWNEDCGDIAGANQNSRDVGAAAVDILLGQLRRNERGVPGRRRTVLIESSWRDGTTARQVHAE
jgi:DNA-binding LacI/PurR family transcriptional regulator